MTTPNYSLTAGACPVDSSSLSHPPSRVCLLPQRAASRQLESRGLLSVLLLSVTIEQDMSPEC